MTLWSRLSIYEFFYYNFKESITHWPENLFSIFDFIIESKQEL